MVQVSTFGEVMEPRATGKPEHGIFASLPRHQQGFDARFGDLWRYYLMYCEGGFRGGGINVHQVTLVKQGESE